MNENIVKLDQAKRLIDEVAATLNGEKHECECCGCTVYAKHREWQNQTTLKSLSYKIVKICEEMARREDILDNHDE